MFAEEEWTDAMPAVKQSHTVKADQLDGKHKSISKQCLKRTLETLGSVPVWEHLKPPDGSDEETDQAPVQHAKTKKKRKKKSSKKRKKSCDPGTEELDHAQATPAKKQRVKPERKKQGKVAPENRDHPEKGSSTDGGKLTRQQWKNKIKNKKQSKNKFLNSPARGKVTEEMSEQAGNRLSVQRETSTSENVPDKKSNGTNLPKESTATCEAPKTNQRDRVEKRKLAEKSKLHANKLRRILTACDSDGGKNPAQDKKDLKPERFEEKDPVDRSSALRSRMEKRLESARFRYINELLYTSTSGEAKRMFRQDPDAVQIYHKGYSAQVKHWPANPVDRIISFIKKRTSSLVVADFGCGDCKIARSVKNQVHCFDLAPVCDLVTVCDMAKVPLADSTVDIAVFCLSLMGTNLVDFLAEANRVLVMGGVLKIAEVASRFDNIRQFTGTLSRLGFKLNSKDTENSHFYSFEFAKTQNAPNNLKKLGLQLKPCLYKKR